MLTYSHSSPRPPLTPGLPLTPQAAQASTGLPDLLAQFAPICLEQMTGVTLLKRSEVKYVLRERQLLEALAALIPYYRVLEVNGLRLNLYNTLYFDTADFTFYHQHHADKRNRYKVRSRSYVYSNRAFFEVKHKVYNGRITKKRISLPDLATRLTPETDAFVTAHAPLNGAALEPKLWTAYQRITLVSRYRPERVTLDVNLQVGDGETAVALPGIAIAEVKYDHRHHQSDFISQMHARHIRINPSSKYCLGVALLYPTVKHNHFKPRLRLIEKLMREEYHVQ